MATDDFKQLDLDDMVCRKANQLAALTEHMTGEGRPAFRALPEDLRAAYCELIRDLSREILDMHEQIGKLRLKERDLKAH